MQPTEQVDLEKVAAVALRFLPEIILSVAIVVAIGCSLFKTTRSWVFYVITLGILLNLFVTSNIQFIIGSATLVTVLISGRRQRMEYYVLITSVLIGAALLVVNTNFIMILLSMELISISSYILTAGTESSRQRAEAAWKFFLYGSVATAVMIFGMSYIYLATDSLSLIDTPTTPIGIIGSVMMLGGFLFKMTATPFHLWAPDVYEATPAPIVAFLSVVPKLAAFSIVMQLPFPPHLIAAFAILTIILGTLAALGQTDSKRMMAYSSVAQAGFFLIIIASGASTSVGIFYAVVFAIMNFVVFMVIDQRDEASFTGFSGFAYRNPFAAIAVTLGLISLVGLPPTAGFMAKLFVFSAVWTKYQDSGQIIFLVLFITGLLAAVASLYFYLKIPFYAFFRRSEDQQPIKISPFTNLLLVILVGLLLALFLAPGLLTTGLVDGLY